MNFQIGKCPKCGKNAELMFSNNPIITPVCFYIYQCQKSIDFYLLMHNLETRFLRSIYKRKIRDIQMINTGKTISF